MIHGQRQEKEMYSEQFEELVAYQSSRRFALLLKIVQNNQGFWEARAL